MDVQTDLELLVCNYISSIHECLYLEGNYFLSVLISPSFLGWQRFHISTMSICQLVTVCTFHINGRYHNNFNPFTPEFLKRMLPFLNLDFSTDPNIGFSLKPKIEWQTVFVSHEEMAHYDLYCTGMDLGFMRCLIWVCIVCRYFVGSL